MLETLNELGLRRNGHVTLKIKRIEATVGKFLLILLLLSSRDFEDLNLDLVEDMPQQNGKLVLGNVLLELEPVDVEVHLLMDYGNHISLYEALDSRLHVLREVLADLGDISQVLVALWQQLTLKFLSLVIQVDLLLLLLLELL